MLCMKVVKEIKDAQQKLYGWRENFFHGKFNKVAFARTWVTWGGDAAHGHDTIPYQIAELRNVTNMTNIFV